MNKPIKTLGEALLKEIDRVRDVVLPEYVAIGASGAPGAYFIRVDLDTAAKALLDWDVLAMLQSYNTLQEITG